MRALDSERTRLDSVVLQIRGLHTMYERQVAALRVGHAAAIARADRAENELARSQATVQWMAAHLTVLEHRGAELEHRLYGTNAIAMNVDASRLRDTPPSTTRMDGEMKGTTVEDEAIPDDILGAESVQALFEDVGDARAKAMGLGDWDDAGHITQR